MCLWLLHVIIKNTGEWFVLLSHTSLHHIQACHRYNLCPTLISQYSSAHTPVHHNQDQPARVFVTNTFLLLQNEVLNENQVQPACKVFLTSRCSPLTLFQAKSHLKLNQNYIFLPCVSVMMQRATLVSTMFISCDTPSSTLQRGGQWLAAVG